MTYIPSQHWELITHWCIIPQENGTPNHISVKISKLTVNCFWNSILWSMQNSHYLDPSMLVNKQWHGKFLIFLKRKEHIPFQLLHNDIHFDSAEHSWCWPDSVVSIATHYRQDSYEFETQWKRHFLHQSRLALGPTQPPAQRVKVPIHTACQWLPTPI